MPAQGNWLNKNGKTYGPYSQEQIDGMRSSGELASYSWLWDGDGKKWVPIDPPAPPPDPGADNSIPLSDNPVEPATSMISRYPGEQGTAMIQRPTVKEAGAAQVLRPMNQEAQRPAREQGTAQVLRPMNQESATSQVQRPAREQGTAQVQRPATKTVKTTETRQIQRPVREAPTSTRTQSRAPTGNQEQFQSPLQAICYDERHVMSGVVSRVSHDRFFLVSDDHASPLPPFKPGMQLWVNLLDEAQGLTENVRCKISNLKRGDGTTWVFEMQWSSRPSLFSSH